MREYFFVKGCDSKEEATILFEHFRMRNYTRPPEGDKETRVFVAENACRAAEQEFHLFSNKKYMIVFRLRDMKEYVIEITNETISGRYEAVRIK